MAVHDRGVAPGSGRSAPRADIPSRYEPTTSASDATVHRLLVPDPVGRWIKRGLAYLPRGQTLSEDVWRVRHRTLSYLLRIHIPIIFCYALIRGYSVSSAAMFAGVIGVFACLSATDPRRRAFVSSMNALGLVTCSAVLVDLSGGLIEMHFHFFVMVSVLTLYQDWLPFLLAVGFVVLHHGVLGVLFPRDVYDHQSAINNPVPWAFVHALFLLAACVASVVAWKLNEEQAFRDALTRLPNRALFQDRVSHALARANRRPGVLAVLFIDLDEFKDVNDSLGHGAGDQLLCLVADRLRACVRPADTAARLGGDEFAILLEDLKSETEAALVAERILDVMTTPFIVGGRDTTIGASIGIAVNTPNDDVDSLLRSADVAMYSVKQSGRARFEFYTTEMLATVVDRVELGREIRGALENEEFRLHYQPIMNLATGEVVGVEALIRWQHPTQGLLLPGTFIGVAEDMGAILAIGDWVLNTACTQVQKWNTLYPDAHLCVSVNVSPIQLVPPAFVTAISSALARSGLPPRSLIIELTEEAMVRDTQLTSTRIHQIKDLGVRLAIDDFGTGYSSLANLRRLPFDIVKIDKEFIDSLPQDESESAFIRSIITLVDALEMVAVAEGVEQGEQANTLRDLGCRLAQGYLFHRPMPVDAMETLLASPLDAEVKARSKP
jgi:diguanylate cyclase (GGDEF)-like protein